MRLFLWLLSAFAFGALALTVLVARIVYGLILFIAGLAVAGFGLVALAAAAMWAVTHSSHDFGIMAGYGAYALAIAGTATILCAAVQHFSAPRRDDPVSG